MKSEQPAWDRQSLEDPHGTPDKARRVRRMFDAIAGRYELINTLFSAGRDSAWRREAVRRARVVADDEVLDIACGTGDLARAFAKADPRLVVGADFSHEMLSRARGRDAATSRWCEADALKLPFADRSFTITSCAFGIRNLQDIGAGFREMHRVLREGGRTVILEFSRPSNRLARLLGEFYSGKFMPALASLISRDRVGAYRYLPRSVVSFPSSGQICMKLREAGFDRVEVTPLSMGVVTVYVGWRDPR